MWIFGYGSIIWKPNFTYIERRPGYINGWKRRLYQGSIDHRGIPGAPGRVVTLLADDTDRCWGVVYRIEGAEAARVLAELDDREQGGYERHYVDVFDDRGLVALHALVYIAAETNPDFLGHAPVDEIARQVRSASGPSGDNIEYVLMLAHSLRSLGVIDEHVFAVETELERLGIRFGEGFYRHAVTAMTRPQKIDFYTSLSAELLLECRAVWSEAQLEPAAQLDRIRPLNEVQLRIIERLRELQSMIREEGSEDAVFHAMKSLIGRFPAIADAVSAAVKRAYAHEIERISRRPEP